WGTQKNEQNMMLVCKILQLPISRSTQFEILLRLLTHRVPVHLVTLDSFLRPLPRSFLPYRAPFILRRPVPATEIVVFRPSIRSLPVRQSRLLPWPHWSLAGSSLASFVPCSEVVRVPQAVLMTRE